METAASAGWAGGGARVPRLPINSGRVVGRTCGRSVLGWYSIPSVAYTGGLFDGSPRVAINWRDACPRDTVNSDGRSPIDPINSPTLRTRRARNRTGRLSQGSLIYPSVPIRPTKPRRPFSPRGPVLSGRSVTRPIGRVIQSRVTAKCSGKELRRGLPQESPTIRRATRRRETLAPNFPMLPSVAAPARCLLRFR
jgi:hypothetical protein